MPVNPDFRDLFAALNAAGAEYLLVGGYALAVHAAPRFTKDLDVWVNPTPENAARVHEALRWFGAPLGELRVEDLSTSGIVFQLGVPPNRIDVLTAIDGVSFPDACLERGWRTLRASFPARHRARGDRAGGIDRVAAGHDLLHSAVALDDERRAVGDPEDGDRPAVLLRHLPARVGEERERELVPLLELLLRLDVVDGDADDLRSAGRHLGVLITVRLDLA